MSARADHEMKVCSVTFDEAELHITMMDGRVFDLPLADYPALARADFAQRLGWMPVDRGRGIAWPALGLGMNTRAGLINSHDLVLGERRLNVPQRPWRGSH